jgi:hypothetical protein
MSNSQDKETLGWVKNKIALTLNRPIETRPDVYGAMRVLCSERDGYDRYVKAYRCDDKQGMIANLSVALQQAINQLEALGQDCAALTATLTECDERLNEKP